MASAINVAVNLVVIVAILAAAHYLQQIRDILRDIRDAKKPSRN